jgi:DNA-binding winged helix-turn-helix (wHTH) protein/predicted Zn-dependent protease
MGWRVAGKEDAGAGSSTEPQRWEYVFGPYRLDPFRELLTCGGKAVALPGRLFALLHSLVGADGNVVSRATLSALIWPGGGVAQSNLSQHVYLLRRILDENDRDREYIMTVPGRGFRFVAPVTFVPAANALRAPVREATGIAAEENPLQAGYDAFACYTRASALLERPTAAGLGASIAQLNAALAIDPAFVPALVAIARAHTLLAQNAYAPGDWALPHALEAIDRALANAPDSAAAHAISAIVALLGQWDWSEAKRAIEMALSFNPASPTVQSSAAWMYERAGDHDRASARLQEALSLAPYSPHLQLSFGKLLISHHDYEQAVRHLSNLLDIDQSFTPARHWRAEAYVLSGRPQDAIVDLLFMQRDTMEDVALRLPLLCCAYAAAGDGERAVETYDRLTTAARTDFVAHTNLSKCAIALSRNAEALDHLERALVAREPSLLYLHGSPWFAAVWPSERFKRILRKVAPRGL